MFFFITTIKEYNYPTPQACRVVKMLGHSWKPIITRDDGFPLVTQHFLFLYSGLLLCTALAIEYFLLHM